MGKEEIKPEYKGCVVSITDSVLGVRTVEVDRIKPEQIPQLKKYGFNFLFQVVKEPEPIYDDTIYTDSPQVKKPRKRRTKKATNGEQ